jgi:Protein of unknown function DUF262
MPLKNEVDKHRKQIRTDGYSVSLGELASMYRDSEIELHPEFQRYFRWTPDQKSRLIESLLLGIPVPSIFVHQRADGVWDVVDGLQRLSCIFEVMGILRNAKGKKLPPLELTGTRYLPSLAGKTWGANEADPRGLGGDLQRLIKRAKLDLRIVLRESDTDTKFELFQRLNTGGTPLSGQELRNCLIIMASPETHDWLRDLANYDPFQKCLALSDRAAEEQYDVELAVRFIVLRRMDDRVPIRDLGSFLDDHIISVATDAAFDRKREEGVFKRTFDTLFAALDERAFRRYDATKQRFLGGFIVSAYEVLALGLGYHFESPKYQPPNVEKVAKVLGTNGDFIEGTGMGVRAEKRLRVTLPLGRKLLGK